MKKSDKIYVRFAPWKQNISEGNERRAKKNSEIYTIFMTWLQICQICPFNSV